MVLLPYGKVLRFVDEEAVRDFAPSGAGFTAGGPWGRWPGRSGGGPNSGEGAA